MGASCGSQKHPVGGVDDARIDVRIDGPPGQKPAETPRAKKRSMIGKALQNLTPHPFRSTPRRMVGGSAGPSLSWLNDADDLAETSEWSEAEDADEPSGTLLKSLCRNEPRDAEILPLVSAEAAKETDSNGMLPLHWAAANEGATETATLAVLAASPESAEARDTYNRTPLHYAARYAPASVVIALISAYPESVRVRDKDGKLPLHIAAANEHAPPPVLAALVEADMPLHLSNGAPKSSTEHAFSWTYAVSSDRPAVADALMLLLAPPEDVVGGHGLSQHIGALVDARDEEGHPALQVAMPDVRGLLYEHLGRQLVKRAQQQTQASSEPTAEGSGRPSEERAAVADVLDRVGGASPGGSLFTGATLTNELSLDERLRRDRAGDVVPTADAVTALIINTARSTTDKDGHYEHTIKVTQSGREWEVSRRYTDFRRLHAELVKRGLRIGPFAVRYHSHPRTLDHSRVDLHLRPRTQPCPTLLAAEPNHRRSASAGPQNYRGAHKLRAQTARGEATVLPRREPRQKPRLSAALQASAFFPRVACGSFVITRWSVFGYTGVDALHPADKTKPTGVVFPQKRANRVRRHAPHLGLSCHASRLHNAEDRPLRSLPR